MTPSNTSADLRGIPMVEKLRAEIERRRVEQPRTEYERGWNCALEEADDLLRKAASDPLIEQLVEALEDIASAVPIGPLDSVRTWENLVNAQRKVAASTLSAARGESGK